MKMIPLRGTMVLLGGFLVHLTLGTVYTFGNMAPYIISYLHAFGDKSNVTENDAIWVQSLMFAGQGLFMCLGGWFDIYLGPRITTYLGSMVASTGVAISYFSIKDSVTLLAVTYGFVFGIGVGLAYISPLATGMKWFPKNKGLVNGIIVGGFGLGAFVFTQVQTRYLNPNNSKINENGYFTDPYVLSRVPKIFLLLGGIYATLQLIGSSMLTVPNEKINEKEPIMDAVNNETNVDASYGSVEKILDCDLDGPVTTLKDDIVLYESYTPKQMFHHRQFYILWFTFFLNSQVVNYISSMYKSYGQTFIKDDQFLATVGAVSAIFNAVGRIIWGLLIDKFNYKVCMLVLTAGLCLFMATLTLTPNGGKYLFAVWLWVIFFLFSGNFTIFPTCTTQTFGIAHAGMNYGLIFTSTVIGSPLAAILTQNLTPLIGWSGVMGLFAGFSSISFLLTLFFRDLQHF